MISAVILTAMTVCVSWAALPPDGWRVPEAVVVESNSQAGAQVVVNGQAVHLIWVDIQERELYYMRSCAAGFGWETKRKLSNANPQLIPTAADITIVSDGGQWVYVAWTQLELVGGQYCVWFSYSTDNGSSWSTPGPITTPYGFISPEPDLGIDRRGWAHLAYLGEEGTSHLEALHYRYFNRQTRMWSHAGFVVGNACHPEISLVDVEPHIVSTYGSKSALYLQHSRVVAGSWVTSPIPGTTDFLNHDFTTEVATGYLHLSAISQTSPYALLYFRSTDNGVQWTHTDLAQVSASLPGPSISSDDEGVFVVYSTGVSGQGKNLFECYSSNHGSGWTGPNQLTELSGDEGPSDMSNGRFGRIVVFDYNLPTEDIWLTANDDTLISNSPEATAFTSGRHLVRDPMNGRLHLVYFSQNRPHYTYSDDEGSTWVPYHIIENLDQTGKDIGIHPSLGLCWTPMGVAAVPCVAYVTHTIDGDTLKYRWWNEFAGQWQGFYVYGAGIRYGAPSVMCFGSDVGLVVVSEDLSQSHVLYSQFPYNAPAPDYIEVIANGILNRFRSPCLTVDGNWDRHAVYEDNGEIVYMRRFAPYDWRPYPPFPPSVPYWSQTPFIEAYGDHLFAPYAEQDGSSSYCDIYRRHYNLYEIPPQWSDPRSPVSQSLGIPSESPVAAWGDFTVWAEQAPGDIEFDSKYYWHPQDQMGFVSIEPLNSYHHHAQMYYDWMGGSTVLMTAWTLGLLSTAPYRIAFRKMSLLPPPDGFGSYYTVTTGEQKPSFFCSKRDTFVQYQRYKVDYGKTELAYQLSLLNPVYPAYRVTILSYFEGSSNRTEQVLVDGRMVAPISLRPNVLNISEILIPRECYQDDHRASLIFKGIDVTKAGLVVYQLEKAKASSYSGGGSQSAETGLLLQDNLLKIEPNPSRGRASVTYGLSQEAKVRCGLYDASGRLVQMLVSSRQSAGLQSLLFPSQLPAGVYFVKLDIDSQSLVKKLVVAK